MEVFDGIVLKSLCFIDVLSQIPLQIHFSETINLTMMVQEYAERACYNCFMAHSIYFFAIIT